MDHDTSTVVVSSSSETMDVLAGVLRFGKSLRNRKGVLIAYLLVAMVSGGAYFVVADRVYQSDGDLMVLPTGADVMDEKTGQAHMIDRDMPTYERMVKSDPVIRATIKALRPEHHRDLLGVEPTDWENSFRRRLAVSTARDTNIMTVSYRSSDPETAYAVLSTLFTQYVIHINSISVRDGNNRRDVLNERLNSVDEMIDEKDKVYLRLLQDSTLLLGNEDEHTNVYFERVKSLNANLTEAGADRLKAEVLLNALKEAIANKEDIQQFYLAMAENVGAELFRNEMGLSTSDGYGIRRLRDTILDDRTKLQNLRTQGYLNNHPRIQDLEAGIANREQELRNLPALVKDAADRVTRTELAPKLLAMARQRYEIAAESERRIQQQYDAVSFEASRLNQQLVEFQRVKAELDSLRQNRENIVSTMGMIHLDQERGLFTDILRDPRIVRRPVAPRLPLVAIVSLFLGFTAACVTIYLLDLLDDRFHTPDDLRSQLGVPILAMVQRLTPLGEQGLEALHTYSRPNSPESEAFRTLRTALDFTGDGIRRLTISSTEPSDGKTTVLANLSVAFAQSGKRTLLIDGDMRRPGLTRLFERGGHAGLSTVLRDARPVADCAGEVIVATDMDNLDVMPAGPKPMNPVELLTDERLSDLIAWAETNYDRILIDAPPSLAVTDAAIIGRLVDGAILTVRPDKNRRKLVLRASEALTSLGCELLGVVINSIEPRANQEYGYGYGYGHSDYGHGDDDGDEPITGPPPTEPSQTEPIKTVETGSTIGIPRDRSDRRKRKRRAA